MYIREEGEREGGQELLRCGVGIAVVKQGEYCL